MATALQTAAITTNNFGIWIMTNEFRNLTEHKRQQRTQQLQRKKKKI